MPNDATVNELFELAIVAEKSAEELYRGLEAKFSHCPEVANFWREYADEEARHARGLERIRDGLKAEQLAALAEPQMLEDARKAAQFSVEGALVGIKNLEDAYQLVSDVENSETNAIFEFLIMDHAEADESRSFMRAHLREHIGKLMTGFPVQFQGRSNRLSVKALQ